MDKLPVEVKFITDRKANPGIVGGRCDSGQIHVNLPFSFQIGNVFKTKSLFSHPL